MHGHVCLLALAIVESAAPVGVHQSGEFGGG